MSQLHVIDHPMVQHKLTIMRMKETGSKDFRELLKEIAMLMGYEVTRDIALMDVQIETPICPMTCKLPKDIENRLVILTDPMLATGGSACDGIAMLKERGCKNIRLMCLVAAPEGIAKVQQEHPDVDIYVAAVDERLNENAYIVPGLGDAGDRIFGTK